MTNVSIVRVREEDVTIPTYAPLPPDPNPMFLEKRINQGASGRVYPNPLTDRISNAKTDRSWRAVFLENEYLDLMILPEIGGRLHAARDKTNGYDFIYRQHVIKPGLIGLLGPWISGGLEFNWPQHHRPTTFLPLAYRIEKGADGSCTVWFSEHEPMDRSKGMFGIRLHPGRACFETVVRLYNRTPFALPFLWWHNLAVHATDEYQVFFPPDVHSVAYHARRHTASFPMTRGPFDICDFGERGADVSWYRNIPLPCSFFAAPSRHDFFGGYDHGRRAGLVHVADHHVSPGKKFFTWGRGDIGLGWCDDLTDDDGPYLELMAGAYSDNQPDFSWIHPYETKTFSQYWYPIRDMGPATNANLRAAVRLEPGPAEARIGVCATERIERAVVRLMRDGAVLWERRADLAPDSPLVETVACPSGASSSPLVLQVDDAAGREVIRYSTEPEGETAVPEAMRSPPRPEAAATVEELFLVGTHLEQYLHPTWEPESYYREALKRDPGESRVNTALGRMALRRGEWDCAEGHFRAAIRRLTAWNGNPRDGEAHYYLGQALWHQGRHEEAYDALAKSAWCAAWQSAAHYALAQMDCAGGRMGRALENLDRALSVNADHLQAANLQTAILRRQGRRDEAAATVAATLALDGLDTWSRHEAVLLAAGTDEAEHAEAELRRALRGDTQNLLDLAFDYAQAGLLEEAAGVLRRADSPGAPVYPMILYALGSFLARAGDETGAAAHFRRAAEQPPEYCFPARLEELLILEEALRRNPSDARAHHYLGNLLYDKKRREAALQHWEHAVRLDPGFSSVPWRNLGMALFNVRHDRQGARRCYEEAFVVNPRDPRLLFELDQLAERLGASPKERLRRLEEQRAVVEQSDTLVMELASLYNLTEQPERALEILVGRRFHPWEGGENPTLAYVRAHYLLGKRALRGGDPAGALRHFEQALEYPPNLRAGRIRPTPDRHIHYHAGLALESLDKKEEARNRFEKAAVQCGANSEQVYYCAMALRKLGRASESARILEDMHRCACGDRDLDGALDFFEAYSADFVLFEDDPRGPHRTECDYRAALALAGLGRQSEASALLRKVLESAPHHPGACERLQEMGGWEATKEPR